MLLAFPSVCFPQSYGGGCLRWSNAASLLPSRKLQLVLCFALSFVWRKALYEHRFSRCFIVFKFSAPKFKGYQRPSVKTTPAKGIDIEATGSINGTPIYDFDLTKLGLEEKPWRKPGNTLQISLTSHLSFGRENIPVCSGICTQKRNLCCTCTVVLNKCTYFSDQARTSRITSITVSTRRRGISTARSRSDCERRTASCSSRFVISSLHQIKL